MDHIRDRRAAYHDMARTERIVEAPRHRHSASVVDVITRSGRPHRTTFAKEALGVRTWHHTPR